MTVPNSSNAWMTCSRGERWMPAPRGMSRLPPRIVGQVDHDRRRGAPHDHPVKRLRIRWIDLHVRQEGRHVNEIAGLRARSVFAPRAPTDFADARQDICDRLLLSMMMDAGTGSRFDPQQPTPQSRLDAELGCDRGQADGARRLRRSGVESGRADNANWGIFGRHDSSPRNAGPRFCAQPFPCARTNVSERFCISCAKWL